jgi:hypothetical protein
MTAIPAWIITEKQGPMNRNCSRPLRLNSSVHQVALVWQIDLAG